MPKTDGIGCEAANDFGLHRDPGVTATKLIPIPLLSRQIQGIDFLGSDIAEDQRGIIRCQAHPKSATETGLSYSLEICDLLDRSIGNSNAQNCGIASPT